jgi:hypothetical protein
MILSLGRGEDVGRLPFVLRLGVGEVTVDLRLGGEERRGEQQAGEADRETHGAS